MYGIAMVVILLGGLLLGTQALLAKYKSSNVTQAEMVSAQFHISSNYLEESALNKEYTVVDWGKGIDIQLYNYEKENVAQIAADDIHYRVTVKNGAVSVSDGINVLSENSGTYILKQSSNRISHNLHIVPDGKGDVVVTVKTEKPFVKTLEATFKIESKLQPEYSVVDQNDGTVKITICTNDYRGGITVKWDAASFSPDNTDENMSGWRDANAVGTVSVVANSVYELLFVKKTADSYRKTEGIGTNIGLGVTVNE